MEICFRGEWGTVCDDSWGTPDAEVVCNELGHSTVGIECLTGVRSRLAINLTLLSEPLPSMTSFYCCNFPLQTHCFRCCSSGCCTLWAGHWANLAG